MQLQQDERLLNVTTALGPDALLLRRLTVTEALDRPYLIRGELVSAAQGDVVGGTQMVGTPITCTVQQGTSRHFHGIISHFGVTGSTLQDRHLYRFEAVPAAWLLTRSMDCRIFQEKTVTQIIQTIVDERGVGPITFKHMPSATRTYCTQFNETDLDFIQRLLDETGCSYFFEQTENDDGWTVTGDGSGYPSDSTEMTVRPELTTFTAVSGWTVVNTVQPARHKAWDFDNLRPSALLQAESPTTLPTTSATRQLEVYR